MRLERGSSRFAQEVNEVIRGLADKVFEFVPLAQGLDMCLRFLN